MNTIANRTALWLAFTPDPVLCMAGKPQQRDRNTRNPVHGWEYRRGLRSSLAL